MDLIKLLMFYPRSKKGKCCLKQPEHVVSVTLNGEFERSGRFFVDCLITYSNSQHKTHQIAQIRHLEPQKRQYKTTEVGLLLF